MFKTCLKPQFKIPKLGWMFITCFKTWTHNCLQNPTAAVGVVVAETPPWPGGVCSMGELERTAGLENKMNVLAL